MEDRIRGVMAAVLGVPAAEITAAASPDTIENWDSVRHMNLVLALEEEFDVRFGEEELVEMLSFDLIGLTVRQHLVRS